MLAHVAALALAAAPATGVPCQPSQQCVQATAAQMFALADKLYAEGDAEAAAGILRALTQDIHPEFRAEARFRLAALLEKQGDLRAAADTLRDLLAEQPTANRARLELARILAQTGDAAGAKAEFARAQAAGLPPEVEQNVRRLASALRTTRKRGATVEFSIGPDSNVNRSTTSPFIDTIIAPFELDADARRQSALAASFSARGFSRDRLGKISLLTNAAFRADLSTKPRFNDVQLALDSGPEARFGKVRLRPSALLEKRWYGGDPYSTGAGGQVELFAQLGPRSQLGVSGSRVRQDIAKNNGQDGWRTALNADLTQSLGAGMILRGSFRYGALDARTRPESLRQTGAGLLLVRERRSVTVFGELDYTRTRGIAPLFLFGKRRSDDRWDVIAGAIFNRANVAGFSPLVRLTHSDSRANIVLYDYRRTRLDVGLTRSF